MEYAMPNSPEERQPREAASAPPREPASAPPREAASAPPREPASAPPREPRSAPPLGSDEEALRRLEQRLDRASEAAERLIAEAAAEATRAGAGRAGHHPGGSGGGTQGSAEAPPAGWQIPEDARTPPSADLDPFVGLVQALRDLIPPELQRRLAAALRELLLALRALIDWYLERLERRREQSVKLEDIPIS